MDQFLPGSVVEIDGERGAQFVERFPVILLPQGNPPVVVECVRQHRAFRVRMRPGEFSGPRGKGRRFVEFPEQLVKDRNIGHDSHGVGVVRPKELHVELERCVEIGRRVGEVSRSLIIGSEIEQNGCGVEFPLCALTPENCKRPLENLDGFLVLGSLGEKMPSVLSISPVRGLLFPAPCSTNSTARSIRGPASTTDPLSCRVLQALAKGDALNSEARPSTPSVSEMIALSLDSGLFELASTGENCCFALA